MKIFKKEMISLGEQAERTREFMEKNYILARVLHDKVDLYNKEVSTLKIRIGTMTIFKDQK